MDLTNMEGVEGDEKYTTLLKAEMNAKTPDISELVGGFWGLNAWIKKRERPYADQNAQADIEGRPRPVRSYGGISRNKSQWWSNSEAIEQLKKEGM